MHEFARARVRLCVRLCVPAGVVRWRGKGSPVLPHRSCTWAPCAAPGVGGWWCHVGPQDATCACTFIGRTRAPTTHAPNPPLPPLSRAPHPGERPVPGRRARLPGRQPAGPPQRARHPARRCAALGSSIGIVVDISHVDIGYMYRMYRLSKRLVRYVLYCSHLTRALSAARALPAAPRARSRPRTRASPSPPCRPQQMAHALGGLLVPQYG